MEAIQRVLVNVRNRAHGLSIALRENKKRLISLDGTNGRTQMARSKKQAPDMLDMYSMWLSQRDCKDLQHS